VAESSAPDYDDASTVSLVGLAREIIDLFTTVTTVRTIRTTVYKLHAVELLRRCSF